MPRIRTLNTKKAPEGWEDVQPQLEEFAGQMRDAVNEPHEGKRRNEATWPITKIHWERSRYVYELFYKKKAISRQLYDFLLLEKFADAMLIAKWRKPGYEFLCSLSAIDKRNSNFGTTAICRVPLHLRKAGQTGPSVSSGCISCASQEAGRLGGPIWWDTPRPADLTGWAKAGCPTADKPGKKRKQMEDDEEADLESRANALRKGSHAGVRDDEAAALDACARALRSTGQEKEKLQVYDGEPEDHMRAQQQQQQQQQDREVSMLDEDDDGDITGDENPNKRSRRVVAPPVAARVVPPPAPVGGTVPPPAVPVGGTVTPVASGTVTPPAGRGGTVTPPAQSGGGHATPSPGSPVDPPVQAGGGHATPSPGSPADAAPGDESE